VRPADHGRGAGPFAFVDDLDHPSLAEGDRHHLARVLRLRSGDPLTVSDGRGAWRQARFGPEIEPEGDTKRVPLPAVEITIAFAAVKGVRPEWAVQKLTEIGVDRIWALTTDRSVVRWDGDRAAGHAERLAKVAREAAMQCRRCRLPHLRTGAKVAEVATDGAALAHPGGAPPGLDRPTVLVGPEGGWSDAELAQAPATVGLGPMILRTETAAVVAGTLFVALRETLVAPVPRSLT
jgi:16S rRNA (uracil1498-N3)-methyltransferase